MENILDSSVAAPSDEARTAYSRQPEHCCNPHHRTMIGQFFFSLSQDYESYAFLPHTALSLWDHVKPDSFGSNPRAIAGACFLLAQKLVDTCCANIDELAEVCGVDNPDEIRRCELRLLQECDIDALNLHPHLSLTKAFSILALSPPLINNAIRFFHMTALLSTRRSYEVYGLAAIHAALQQEASTTKYVNHAEEAIDECAQELLTHASSGLGVRFSLFWGAHASDAAASKAYAPLNYYAHD